MHVTKPGGAYPLTYLFEDFIASHGSYIPILDFSDSLFEDVGNRLWGQVLKYQFFYYSYPFCFSIFLLFYEFVKKFLSDRRLSYR